jgi:hypothetical protein
MKVISIHGGAEALVDDEWFVLLARCKWSLAGSSKKYARSRAGYMHRIIAGAGTGEEVDHVNGNPLDNRSENLRICDHSQNMANSRQSVGESGYRGVKPKGNGWVASIQWKDKQEGLGVYGTPEEAAAAYNVRALELFGEFAILNAVTATPVRLIDKRPTDCKLCGSRFSVARCGRPRKYCSRECLEKSRVRRAA